MEDYVTTSGPESLYVRMLYYVTFPPIGPHERKGLGESDTSELDFGGFDCEVARECHTQLPLCHPINLSSCREKLYLAASDLHDCRSDLH
jgi:hypothetical protein